MKKLLLISLFGGLLGCQHESLDIQAPYRIKLSATPDVTQLKVGAPVRLSLDLQTDSYYSASGYQLLFYQQTGLGRLRKDTTVVRQNVGVPLALGRSNWTYTPQAAGTSEIVLVARQERGYTQPDTVRFSFQVAP